MKNSKTSKHPPAKKPKPASIKESARIVGKLGGRPRKEGNARA